MLSFRNSPEGRAAAASLRDFFVQQRSPRAVLFHAAASGRVALLLIDEPDDSLQPHLLASSAPVLVLIGADYGAGEPDPPPAKWRCVKTLRVWAAAAIVHGAAGEAYHYYLGAEAARTFRRLVFVESSGARVRDWIEALHCQRTLAFVPDGQHPVAPILAS